MDICECYEIQMARNEYIKADEIPSDIPMARADSVCRLCKYNHFHENDELADVLHYLKFECPYPSIIHRQGFSIRFHDEFIFEYQWNQWYPQINGNDFSTIDLADLECFLRELVVDDYVIIQYNKRFLHKIPFRIISKKKFKQKKNRNKFIKRIFTVKEVLYDSRT